MQGLALVAPLPLPGRRLRWTRPPAPHQDHTRSWCGDGAVPDVERGFQPGGDPGGRDAWRYVESSVLFWGRAEGFAEAASAYESGAELGVTFGRVAAR